ncbi:MAG TPA: Uma2 family endonuclease [Thermodesulfovibrionia bacterium]|nr:Uma2 family endonuclease [Thermodesulfovibrionia bacterium]
MIETLTQKHTIEDYQRLAEGAPYQLIDGELIMSPAPKPKHQRILMRIIEKLIPLSKGRGDLFVAPVDVYFDDEDAFQPDIIFISNQKKHIIKDDGIYGAPDLVIEILSKSTAYYDLNKKFKVYEKYGVNEYWIIDPDAQTIELYRNDQVQWSEHQGQ